MGNTHALMTHYHLLEHIHVHQHVGYLYSIGTCIVSYYYYIIITCTCIIMAIVTKLKTIDDTASKLTYYIIIIIIIFKCYFSGEHIARSINKNNNGANIALGKTNRLKALCMMQINT